MFRLKSYLVEKAKDLFDDFYSFTIYLASKLPICEQDRPFRFAFDIFMLFYLLFFVANILLKQAFELKQSDYISLIWVCFEIFPMWLFLFQAFLDLNTSYYSKGMYISNRLDIVKNYMKYNFLLDLVTIAPLFANNTQYEFIEIIVTLRLINVESLVRRLEEYLQLKGKKEGLFQLLKLIINLLFLAHMSACAWHYVGLTELKNGVDINWLTIKGIEFKSWYIRYIYSFYFSIVTMMTVGYGDISPNNYIECMFLIFMIIYGCGVFAYSINNIGIIFKEMYQEEKEFK